MLTKHKSDPNSGTSTSGMRNRRKLKKQQTSISRQSSSSESFPPGYSLYQMLMNTKSAVQGIGYNVRHFLFDESRPVLGSGQPDRAWILGEFFNSAGRFYAKWSMLNRMTYRRHWVDHIINPVTNVVYDSDTGWGCTIRSCQMLVAHALCRSGYNRKRVPALFSDCESSCLSIQRFVHADDDKRAGEWFGPTSVTLTIEKLLRNPDASALGLGIYVSLDGRLYKPDIQEESKYTASASSAPSSVDSPRLTLGRTGRVNSWNLCAHEQAIECPISISSSLAASPRSGFIDVGTPPPRESPSEEFWMIEEPSSSSEDSFINMTPGILWSRPVLVIVAIRLSPTNEATKAQLASLMWYMTLPWFVGVLGGPDRRCHYIVGLVEERGDDVENGESPIYNLLSIDPHIVQEAAVRGIEAEFRNAEHPARISPSMLCPSVAIGFLVSNQDDLEKLEEQINRPKEGSFIEVRNEANPTYCPREYVSHEEEGENVVLLG